MYLKLKGINYQPWKITLTNAESLLIKYVFTTIHKLILVYMTYKSAFNTLDKKKKEKSNLNQYFVAIRQQSIMKIINKFPQRPHKLSKNCQFVISPGIG